jgi:hypothetical protein
MKYLLTIILLAISFSSNATIVYQRDVKITQVNAYDDVENVAAYVYLSSHHPDCPSGVYLNPNAPHFNSMYSLTVAAFMAGKTVTFQLYNDRLNSNRCEADAIQVFAK